LWLACPAQRGRVGLASRPRRQVLLDLLHRVATRSSVNGMDAAALADALAPCLAWQPPPPRKARARTAVARLGVWAPACILCLLYVFSCSGVLP